MSRISNLVVKPYTLATTVGILNVVLWGVLQFAAHTPRARQNVMQVVAVLFLAAVLKRSLAHPTPEQTADPTKRQWSLWPALIISAATWAWVIPCYFTSDDFSILHQAQSLTGSTMRAFLTRSQATTFFRPLGQASLLLDYQLWHLSPAGYHSINLLLHLASVAGVYFLGRQFQLRRDTAAAWALIFGVLPIQVEAVAWMICRFDLLATFFTIWTVVCYAAYRNSGRAAMYWAALFLFIASMLSKESGYVVPLLLLSAESFVFPKPTLKPLAGVVAAAASVFIFRWIHLGGIGGYVSSGGSREVFIFHLKTVEGLFLRGPSQTVLGINWLQPGSAWFTAACSTLAMALLLAVFSARLTRSERSAVRFGLCWMLASLIPVHSLILIGPGLTNARVLYMCSAGAAIVIGTLLAGIHHRAFSRALTAIVVVLFSVAVLHNCGAWRSTTELSRAFPEQLKRLLPAPPQDAEFVFQGMPETIRGVFFYRIGLQDVIQMAYGRGDLKASREETEASKPATGRVIRFQWDDNRPVLVRPNTPRSGEPELR